MYKKLVSVIIVTYNSSEEIFNCLESLYQCNDIGMSLEVIIVDNNSMDRHEMLEVTKRYANIRVIFNNQNGGYGQGNNIGIEAASSSIILIMNPDVRLFRPIFKDALQCFSDYSLGILGMRQCETEEIFRQSYLPLSQSVKGVILYKLYSSINQYSPRFFCIHGACFFARKAALKEIGLYDENIFLYNEEMDIHYRLLRQKKYSVKYNKKLFYIHPMHHRIETLKELQQRYLSYMYVYRKLSFNQYSAICKYIHLYRLYILRSYLKRNIAVIENYKAFYNYLLQQKELLKY